MPDLRRPRPSPAMLSRIVMLILAACMAGASAQADNRKEIEQRLKAAYEGKLLVLRPTSGNGDIHFISPKEEVDSIKDTEIPFLIVIEKVKLKKSELLVHARRVFLYKDANKKTHRFAGPEAKYRLKWKQPERKESALRETLEKVFALPDNVSIDWNRYWPPEVPTKPPRQLPQHSREIAPGIFTIGSDAIPPECESCPDPGYSEAARSNKVQGVVLLRCVITETGRVAGIQVVGSLGYGLNEQAVMAVLRWRFKPATLQGKPISIVMNAEIHFRLFQR